MESRKVFEVSVNVIGVKKRCRNADRHSFKIAQIDFKELSDDDVKEFTEKAKTLLKANMREIPANAILQFTKMEISEFCRSMELFDKANKSFQIETGV